MIQTDFAREVIIGGRMVAVYMPKWVADQANVGDDVRAEYDGPGKDCIWFINGRRVGLPLRGKEGHGA